MSEMLRDESCVVSSSGTNRMTCDEHQPTSHSSSVARSRNLNPVYLCGRRMKREIGGRTLDSSRDCLGEENRFSPASAGIFNIGSVNEYDGWMKVACSRICESDVCVSSVLLSLGKPRLRGCSSVLEYKNRRWIY